MAAQPVEWVLTIFYGQSAHRATYGRLDGRNTKYTKDYIQLSRKPSFLDPVKKLFPAADIQNGSVLLTYKWPTGSAPGALVMQSADRPHLKWDTSRRAPKAWKMTASPSETTEETIPGDPTHTDFQAAENELRLLSSRGAGQPYLIAVKLKNEPNILHLRAYLRNPSAQYGWADVKLAPKAIQDILPTLSARSAHKALTFESTGTPPSAKVGEILSRLALSLEPRLIIESLDTTTGRELAKFLRNPSCGLFFEPSLNHDAWTEVPPVSEQFTESTKEFLTLLDTHLHAFPEEDAFAELLEADPEEVEKLQTQFENNNFSVPDITANVKTRGSAQKVFSRAVKTNYGDRCAVTGIMTKSFLVASHIVPWSADESIRLDPANGICLSLLVDRAFEKGYMLIADDLSIRIDWVKIGDDQELRKALESYEGGTVALPMRSPPKHEYLQRKRSLVNSGE